MLKVILVRHAESKMNKLGIHQGQLLDFGLSQEGVIQAKKLARRIKKENITEIYSSDLKRALQTAEIVGNEIGIEVRKDARLREFTMGDFDKFPDKRHTLFKEFYKEQLRKGLSRYDIRPPNGENIWDFIKRIKSFLKEIEKKSGQVLVISHGGTISTALNIIENREKKDFRKIKQDNASINILEFANNKWKIKAINDSRHIDDLKLQKKYEI